MIKARILKVTNNHIYKLTYISNTSSWITKEYRKHVGICRYYTIDMLYYKSNVMCSKRQNYIEIKEIDLKNYYEEDCFGRNDDDLVFIVRKKGGCSKTIIKTIDNVNDIWLNKDSGIHNKNYLDNCFKLNDFIIIQNSYDYNEFYTFLSIRNYKKGIYNREQYEIINHTDYNIFLDKLFLTTVNNKKIILDDKLNELKINYNFKSNCGLISDDLLYCYLDKNRYYQEEKFIDNIRDYYWLTTTENKKIIETLYLLKNRVLNKDVVEIIINFYLCNLNCFKI